MEFIDTHTHFYLEHFDSDREEVMNKCLQSGVKKMLLPNIDRHSIEPMLKTCKQYPLHCYPMLGLHPSDVKENYQEELNAILQQFNKHTFIAVGEVGMDLYWDRTFIREQEKVLCQQIDFALRFDLPLVIHSRKSFAEILAILNEYSKHSLKGVFHCFSGDINQAKKVIEKGFYLGIGGTITYKNSGIQHVVKEIPLNHLLLETDAPFLPPVPHRGKRNQSSYIPIIASHIAEIKEITLQEVAATTTKNASILFKM
ncbi:MAG: TatD family hydrolase [Bacteroidales bacterium]|nr:TatD family hydrolase [Bacteroidales bacterium]MDD4209078.1 TatD family hydrolase [Bacteroidales bacterium]